MKLLLCWPDSRSAPSSQAGWNRQPALSWGGETGPQEEPESPLASFSPAWSSELSPCPSLPVFCCVRASLSPLCFLAMTSLLSPSSSPFPAFPPSPLSPLFSCEEQSSISRDPALARGLHLSSLLSLRPRVGLPTSPQLCLKEPHPGRSSCGCSVPGCAAPCEILAGPLPALPDGGAGLACFPHPVQGHQQGPPAQLEITPRPHQLPFALPVPGGSPLPLLMPWTLPELTVTIWMVPLPGGPCSGICTERLKTVLGGCLAHHSGAHPERGFLGVPIQCSC